ncbi:CGNR zinc finger domain-containing protein [Ilumatobacter coccineus]|jgi:predicted RNA-binding Zn ribbon-like protein|uniref:Zinc finger CGNR domain-containing protein n=1 Tax=Ilumatobacter coccineus (strain NBRC 103263 / KCTC 29153 / YM16-304) TaxID=1313172 RepID=A0A6C7DTZ2_ILUCY|nr:CGNR zinc finger domain-containing protein [Ilumatobacter coccineus]BAN00424.1 hypothetical protein YM304_01100 [Ilumatobacter coccineus YM16-304]
MYVASVTESEARITLETLLELSNGLTDESSDTRSTLDDAGFSRAAEASEASVQRVTQRIAAMTPFLTELPDLDIDTAAAKVTEELIEIPITPSIVDHGGVGHHIHWTPATAKFDDQVMADLLMALAQEICDNGTIRFGRCGADDCERLFYDATRNRSKRFCSDPRCASRTHTADHRARKRR